MKLPDNLSLRTVADDPRLADQIQTLIEQTWPAYVLESHAPPDNPLPTDWMGVYRRWPHLQFGLFDGQELVAGGNALTLAWNGDVNDLPESGWAWAMNSAAQDHDAGRQAHTLCALGITIRSDQQGRGLSRTMVEVMRELGAQTGFGRMLAPVRPSWKSRYPLTSIDDYCTWTTADGLPFDPWMRVHTRLGAKLVKPCHCSMLMSASVAEWEHWSGLRFPVSGEYAVPDLLGSLQIDLTADRGETAEPNVWMVHQ